MYPTQERLLATLGERLRLARLRRRISVALMCERADISRVTLYRAEQGNAAVAIGTYLRILSVLGLQHDLDGLAADDRLGHRLQDEGLPPKRKLKAARP